MSTDRETTRIVRSWLESGATRLPDRVLDAVLDQLPATPQRRSWWATRRFAEMNRLTQALIAAAAVLIVLVVGYTFLPRSSGVGGVVEPSPTTSPAPIPSGSMGPGFYRVSDPSLTILPYTFTVSAGSIGGDGVTRGDPFSGSGVKLSTWLIDHVYGDGCHWSGTLVPVSTKAQLVAALVAQVGDTHSTPVETTIGGLAATKITMSLDPNFDMKACNNDVIVRMWPDPGPDESGGWGLTPGETVTVYALEANGKVGLLMTVQHVDSPPADVAELQAILASVHFEQPTPSGP